MSVEAEVRPRVMSCSKLLRPPRAALNALEFRTSSESNLMRPRVRRIVHKLTEEGTARLIYDENAHTLRGVLINGMQDTFSIHGKPMRELTDINELHAAAAADQTCPPSTSHRDPMKITIVEGETGEKYEIDDVQVEICELINPITQASHLVVHIDHPAIRFQTKEVLIGNRADVEISQFINPEDVEGDRYLDPELSPTPSKKVLVGRMSLKVVAREKTQPTIRRMSENVNMSDVVIEQTNDFLA